jgi:Fuc2NAc and GlcNAc transferase
VTTLQILALCLGSFMVSYALSTWIRGFALRKGILDIPSGRSSHSVATPRGGGLAFVIIFLATVLAFLFVFPSHQSLWIALLGGGALVSIVGWLDDRKGLPSWVRLFFYGLAIVWAVYWIGGLPRIETGIGVVRLGLLGYFVAWFVAFTFVNLYNFMDGIDGLAAGEGLVVSAVAGGILAIVGDWELAVVCWVLAAALAGFLRWNWPPAKIFMGDVGSNLLGFVFCILAIASENRGSMSIWVWVILLSVFWVDGVATLTKRLLRGKPPYEAHREHAYQRAVQAGYSHRQVTLTILLINLALGGVGFLAWRWPVLLLPVVLVVYALLFMAWWHFSHLPSVEIE